MNFLFDNESVSIESNLEEDKDLVDDFFEKTGRELNRSNLEKKTWLDRLNGSIFLLMGNLRDEELIFFLKSLEDISRIEKLKKD